MSVKVYTLKIDKLSMFYVYVMLSYKWKCFLTYSIRNTKHKYEKTVISRATFMWTLFTLVR